MIAIMYLLPLVDKETDQVPLVILQKEGLLPALPDKNDEIEISGYDFKVEARFMHDRQVQVRVWLHAMSAAKFGKKNEPGWSQVVTDLLRISGWSLHTTSTAQLN